MPMSLVKSQLWFDVAEGTWSWASQSGSPFIDDRFRPYSSPAPIPAGMGQRLIEKISLAALATAGATLRLVTTIGVILGAPPGAVRRSTSLAIAFARLSTGTAAGFKLEVGPATITVGAESPVELIGLQTYTGDFDTNGILEGAVVDLPEAYRDPTLGVTLDLPILWTGRNAGTVSFLYWLSQEFQFSTFSAGGQRSMSNIKNVVGKPTVVDDGMRVISQTLIDGANDWTSGNAPPIVHLYSNDPPITPALVLSDMVECAFSGYSEVSLDSLTAANDGDDTPVLQNDFLAQFELTAADTLDSATGYYWTNADGDSLIGAERFDEGFPFDEIGDQVNITPIMELPGFSPP